MSEAGITTKSVAIIERISFFVSFVPMVGLGLAFLFC